MMVSLFRVFFLFFIFFHINSQSCEEIIEKTKEILQKTEFAPYLNSLTRAPGIKFNLFFMTDGTEKYVIKMMRRNQFLLAREKFCSDFAAKAGFIDAIVPIEGLYGKNELIVGKYCHFKPMLKTKAVSLGDALDYAKEKERIIPEHFISLHRKKLWNYNTCTKEYDLEAFDQLNFEKALVFSFITLQWDQHRKNILLQIESENPFIIKFKLIDFSNSMTENKGVAEQIWPGRVVHPCSLLCKRFFRKYLEKIPSVEIKELINNLINLNYDDLFDGFEQKHQEIDKNDFLKRISDLIEAFNNSEEKTIGEIMENLFLSRYPFNLIIN
jgi:hypothetical protein